PFFVHARPVRGKKCMWFDLVGFGLIWIFLPITRYIIQPTALPPHPPIFALFAPSRLTIGPRAPPAAAAQFFLCVLSWLDECGVLSCVLCVRVHGWMLAVTWALSVES